MDPEDDLESAKLWLPPGYRGRARFRRSLLRGVVVIPIVVIAGLWWLVSLDGPAERAEATRFCGTALALVIAAMVGSHWPAVVVTPTHLSWVALPWPGKVQWKDIRSAELLDGSVRTGRSRVRTQWMTFVVHDSARNRDVTRHLAMLGMPRRELLLQCADNAAPTNPQLASTLQQTAERFEPVSRRHAIGSSPAAFCLATAIGVASAAAAVLTAL